MYSVTPWLGRIGFEDNPTTAIVLNFFRISRIVSAPGCVKESAPSGTKILIALRVHPCLRASRSPAPWPTNIFHFLPPSPPKSLSLRRIPPTPAPARSRPFATGHRSALCTPPPPPPPP